MYDNDICDQFVDRKCLSHIFIEIYHLDTEWPIDFLRHSFMAKSAGYLFWLFSTYILYFPYPF